MPMDKRLIAKIRHFAWTCYQLGAGQPYNETPTEEQIQSQVNGLEAFKQHPDMTPEENHENWMRFRLAQGWKYGPVKDAAAKTHPDLVPFGELPDVEKRKDIMDIWSTRFALRVTSQAFETLEAQLAEARTAITDLLGTGLPTIGGKWSEAVERAKKTLAGDTTQGDDARVGRAVEEWIKDHITVATEWWSEDIIVDLRRIVAQAKAGEPHGG